MGAKSIIQLDTTVQCYADQNYKDEHDGESPLVIIDIRVRQLIGDDVDDVGVGGKNGNYPGYYLRSTVRAGV